MAAQANLSILRSAIPYGTPGHVSHLWRSLVWGTVGGGFNWSVTGAAWTVTSQVRETAPIEPPTGTLEP
jgi:hypothetical protein